MSERLSVFDDPVADDPEIDEQPPERRNKRRKALVISVAALLVLALGAGGTVIWYLHRIDTALSNIKREDLMPRGAWVAGEASVLPTGKGINYVLMGTDTRPGDAGRSDSLIVAHVTENRDKVYLISFPRDLWVDIPGHGKGKINWAYAFGGPELTIRTLNQLLGVRMDHAAVVDFEGFIRLTEALDGVEVFNKRGFRSGHNGQYYPAGMVTLKGDSALGYVRERYNLPNGDLDRAENQRDVVRAILDKAARPSVLGNPAAVDGMLTQLSGAITVDKALTNEKIRETALSMRVRSGSDIVNFQAPMTGFGWAGDQAIAIVNAEQMAELGVALRDDQLDEYLAKFPDSCTGPNC